MRKAIVYTERTPAFGVWLGYVSCVVALCFSGAFAQESLTDLSTQSGFPKVSVAVREADERRRLYQPKGFEKSGIRLDAGFEERIVWDDNPLAQSSRGRARLRAVSSAEGHLVFGPRDWRLGAEGRVRDIRGVPEDNDSHVDGGLVLSLEGEAWRSARLSARFSARRSYETPGDPLTSGTTVCPIPVETYRAAAKKLTRRALWFMALGGQAQKEDYHAGCFADGRPFPQDDRDRLELQSFLRLGASPTSQLDIFWGASRRISLHHHVQPYSTQLGFKEDRRLIGVAFDMNDRLIGEVSHGRSRVHWFSPLIHPVEIPVTEVSASWSVTPLTTVAGLYEQSVKEGSQLGYAGALFRHVSIGAHHELLRNVELGVKVSHDRWVWQPTFLQEDIEQNRQDDKTTLELSTKFSLGPHVYLGVDARREWAQSSESYNTHNRTRVSARIGVRL